MFLIRSRPPLPARARSRHPWTGNAGLSDLLRMLPRKKRPAAPCVLKLYILQRRASRPEQTSVLAGRLGSWLGCRQPPSAERKHRSYLTVAFRRAAVQVFLLPCALCPPEFWGPRLSVYSRGNLFRDLLVQAFFSLYTNSKHWYHLSLHMLANL